jgi:hypothetical protein
MDWAVILTTWMSRKSQKFHVLEMPKPRYSQHDIGWFFKCAAAQWRHLQRERARKSAAAANADAAYCDGGRRTSSTVTFGGGLAIKSESGKVEMKHPQPITPQWCVWNEISGGNRRGIPHMIRGMREKGIELG